jgi:hypothetical protein
MCRLLAQRGRRVDSALGCRSSANYFTNEKCYDPHRFSVRLLKSMTAILAAARPFFPSRHHVISCSVHCLRFLSSQPENPGQHSELEWRGKDPALPGIDQG